MNEEKTLTDDELKTLKKKAFDILSHSRHVLLAKYPFIGSIALRMDLVPVRDMNCRTACTDGDNVYFDIAFLSSLNCQERVFVLAHEVWHAVLMHLTRRGNRLHDLFNIATDKEVNNLLKDDGLTPPENLCFPENDEIGKCAEEIYEIMLKKMQKQQKSQQNGKGKQQKSGSSGGSSQAGKQGQDSSGSGAGDFSGQFDKHIYDEDSDSQSSGDQPSKNPASSGDDAGDSNGFNKSMVTDKYGKVGHDPDFKPHVSKNFNDRMRETVIAEAQRAAKMRGNVPSYIKSFVDKLLTPEVKWEEVLAQFVTKSYKGGIRTWIPPNRRHVYNDIYMQSRQGNKIKLAVIIDTSGSTSGDRGKFLAELNSLVKSFGQYSLDIIECDAEVGDIKHFTQDDDFEHIVESGEYVMTGGGGTSMLPALNAVVDNHMDVDAVVCLTDGYIDDIPKNPTDLPMLWVITKDGTEDFCNWGQKIKLKVD